jgi:hypothetical protein
MLLKITVFPRNRTKDWIYKYIGNVRMCNQVVYQDGSCLL